MLMLTAGLHGHLHQALQSARRSAGALHIRQLTLGNRANRLNLEHLPHHRQRRGNTATAAQRIQGRDIEVERGLLADGLNVVHQLRGGQLFRARVVRAQVVRARNKIRGSRVQHLQGAHHRMTVGTGDRTAIHHAHARRTQAAQAGTGACRLHRARELTGQMHRYHMRKTSRCQLVIHISKHARRGP